MKLLLVDYPYPDGEARAKALKDAGVDVRVFNLVKSRVWPGASPVKEKLKPLSLLAPLRKAAYALDRARLNSELLSAAAEFMPDAVLAVKGDNITAGTFRKLREITGAPVLLWDADSMLSRGRREFMLPRLGLFDHYFTVDDLGLLPAELRKAMSASQKNITTVPFAASGDYASVAPAPGLSSSIVFLGTVNPARKRILEKLSKFDLRIWGPRNSGWGEWLEPGSPLEKCYQNASVYGEGAAAVYRGAAVTLDVHFLFGSAATIPNVTMRVYEVPAAGGFVLANRSAQLERLFKDGEEMASYSSEGELMEKAEYYLSNPSERKRLAENARRRVLSEHTFSNRLKTIFKAAKLDA